MVNKSGRIGRDGEHVAVKYLQEAGFLAEREGRRKPSEDVIGLPIPVEVKRRKTLSVPLWTRQLRQRHGSAWALFVIARDARKADAHPDLMILPAALGSQALAALFKEAE